MLSHIHLLRIRKHLPYLLRVRSIAFSDHPDIPGSRLENVPNLWHKLLKRTKCDDILSSIVQPVTVKPYNDPDGINVGEELTGILKKGKTDL